MGFERSGPSERGRLMGPLKRSGSPSIVVGMGFDGWNGSAGGRKKVQSLGGRRGSPSGQLSCLSASPNLAFTAASAAEVSPLRPALVGWAGAFVGPFTPSPIFLLLVSRDASVEWPAPASCRRSGACDGGAHQAQADRSFRDMPHAVCYSSDGTGTEPACSLQTGKRTER